MQITIKDTLIKSILADYVENVMDKRQPKLAKEIFEDPKFHERLSKALSTYFNEEADVIADRLEDLKIPQLDKALAAQDRE